MSGIDQIIGSSTNQDDCRALRRLLAESTSREIEMADRIAQLTLSPATPIAIEFDAAEHVFRVWTNNHYAGSIAWHPVVQAMYEALNGTPAPEAAVPAEPFPWNSIDQIRPQGGTD